MMGRQIGHQDCSLGSCLKKAAAAQATQPIHVPMIIGSANPVPKYEESNVNTSGTKPPQIAPW